LVVSTETNITLTYLLAFRGFYV